MKILDVIYRIAVLAWLWVLTIWLIGFQKDQRAINDWQINTLHGVQTNLNQSVDVFGRCTKELLEWKHMCDANMNR